MRRFAQASIALVGALAIAACVGDTARNDMTGTTGTTADVDRDWVNDRLEEGDAEVRLGRLAQQKGASDDVRAFGATMVEHHTMAGTELKRVAGELDVEPETDRDLRDGLFERLSALDGNDFDRTYLEAMVDEHEDAVEALEDKATDDDEHADVKAWANRTLPTVKQHLERAKDLRARVANNM